jgi:quercetin dioxygenase-like cupin family protein
MVPLVTDSPVAVIHLPDAEDDLRILLRASDADGSLGAVEMVMDPGNAGPPLHLHPGHAESFYVLSGRLTLRLGDSVLTGGPGTWGTAPKGTPHTLANFGDEPARVLCLFSPAGFERRFQRMVASAGEARGLAELHEHERATRLLGPPLAPPAADGPWA